METRDPEFGAEDRIAISALTPLDVEAIDQAILSHCEAQWRKVAYVVVMAMNAHPDTYLDIPDAYYATRVRELVAEGLIEAQGDLRRIRFSEVRLGTETQRDPI